MSEASAGGAPGEPYRRFLARLREVRSQGVLLGLDRVRLALERLGSPERGLAAVHIAGTNGKGSVAAMTEAILRRAGLRTGLFTSPHLVRFTERIRIAGVEIDGDVLGRLDPAVWATGVPLTYFEIATVLAFLAFAEAGVELAVLETGLGGRLDATSVCHPVACAITSIALDHEAMLGSSLDQIAAEKAGIAKSGIPLFLGPLPPEAEASVVRSAALAGAPIRRLGVDYPPAPVEPALSGEHQRGNAAIAAALAREAARAVGRTLAEDDVMAGLRAVRWPGRLERVTADVLLDCAHNVEGTRALAAALPESPRRALVASIVRDKDARTMLAVLAPHFDRVVLTRSPSERAVAPAELGALISSTRGGRLDVVCLDDPTAALAEARRYAAEAPEGLVVVAGSIFLVGAVRAHLVGERHGPTDDSDPLP